MIQVQGLTKYYGDLCAVDHISLDIQRGEILGLLGPNGAGKTTVLRMLTGYLRPTEGTIRVKDYAIDKNPLEIKRLIGYLPESAPLYRDMLVYDYLGYVADIREIDKKRKFTKIRKLAELCGLNEVMHQPIGELSKGYNQRVGLAHAMMNDPEILILDEPTSGLDPNQIAEIREIIRRIGKEKTIIISTHILSEAEAACNRVVIINRGTIVADGSTETLGQSTSQGHLITVALQNADLEAVERELYSIQGIEDISALDEQGDSLEVRITCRYPEDLRGEIYKRIKQTNWVLMEFHQETRSLETIFRSLTKEA
ncbi:MAG: ATP-binding cassette domain-containing protein [Deltaproteobacteria bacterium]|nr:ATP-binding cassette domain-containing protein [Deltaproteobacteria bacterium]MBW2310506.1 ATP-binding cassette domain-containing protein [Deltaproteobacteria bacterium]